MLYTVRRNEVLFINMQDKLTLEVPIARTTWRDYLTLCKPRVVALMLLTAIVGMQLASPGLIPWHAFVFGTIGIAFCAGSAAVINHLADRHIDAAMARTEHRPLPKGKITPHQALFFAMFLGVIGMFVLLKWVNLLTALLTLLTLIGYAGVYTLYLKRATPQNIVIGGLAGAAPPLLGWTAVTGHLDPYPLLLVLIIFTWTPPHFWALSIYRLQDYAATKIPMLPVTHGVRFTKINILLYTFLLIVTTLLPFVVEMSGYVYLIGALLLDAYFLYFVIKLFLNEDVKIAIRTFHASIVYLMLLFLVLLVDHYLLWGVNYAS